MPNSDRFTAAFSCCDKIREIVTSAPEFHMVSDDISAVNVKVEASWNLTTVFGWLLRYPVLVNVLKPCIYRVNRKVVTKCTDTA